MKKHYETHVEDTDKLISVAGPVLDYKSWYEQYRKLMEEQAQRKYGLYTPTSEGDDDDFPSIPGIVARYSALGLTNEQMAENPVWKDLTGNGHDLRIKNFAWSGMSGVGGYGDENHLTFYNFTLDDYNFVAIKTGAKHMNFTFRVTGLQPGNKLTLAFFGTTATVYGTWDKDGIYTVNSAVVEVGKPVYFYNGYGATRGEFTIEILPLYPGALVFDGVDDYGVCDNFPILTKEKGYTVVALRQYLVDKSTAYLTANGDSISNTSFILEGNNHRDTWNFGRATTIQASRILATQTSKQYDGVKLNIGTNTEGSNLLQVGKWSKSYSNVAIWELVFLDHDATEEELTKIKDYFVKTYPWLFPDQAWTVVGKTNEDEDRATIANITGNGNNLVLSNFGFAEGSGYGLYAYNFNSFNFRDNVVKPTDVKKDSFRIIGTGNNSNVLVLSNTSNSADWKIRITGMKEGDRCLIGNANKSGEYISVNKDGTYTFQKQYAATSTNGIWYNSSQEVDVLVEQIPEYEGYLITDGVDDKVASVNAVTLNKDFTVVGEWRFKETEIRSNCGIVVERVLFVYNIPTGIRIYIHEVGGNFTELQNIKSLKAICSNGIVYDENWNPISVKVGSLEEYRNKLLLGYLSNLFTQMAFKNMSIYSNQVLSKDDCIKAYNYLQTLKAK